MSEIANKTTPTAPDYSGLPSHWRKPMELRDQKMDYAKIAETLDLPIGTVKSRIHRARAAIAKKAANSNGAS